MMLSLYQANDQLSVPRFLIFETDYLSNKLLRPKKFFEDWDENRGLRTHPTPLCIPKEIGESQ